ncbi:DUF2550 domain-containing protein [Actinomyces vulturis]|uniref:DUF2550 domain-containing protein n=1 Tax=Actinomyces vulturis TaxID=1857645 RepID=UPI0008379A75|nr:DUF2550 domain-containing protein [Actinomyces vulturis]
MHPGWWAIIGALVALIVCVLLLFFFRLRGLAGRWGAFECAMRVVVPGRWTSGIAVFGDTTLDWYRLVSLSWRPVRSWNRDDLEVGEARPRERVSRVVDVTCKYRGQEFELGMVEDSHSALVSWTESAAPTQPRLF